MAGIKSSGMRRTRAAPTISAAATGGRILAPVLPLVTVIYMFLLFPIETRPEVLGVNLPIYRLGILLFLPFMLARLTSVRSRFLLPDWLIVMATVWSMIAFCVVYGLAEGFVRAAGVVVDFAGAYALARVAIDSPVALRRFLILISPGLFLAGVEMLLESISGTLIVRPLFAQLFGAVSAYESGEVAGTLRYMQDQRLGLLRAYGPFSHPILGGAILVSMLPLWLKSGIRSWPLWLGVASSLMGLYSVSSAAFMGFAFGIALVMTDWGKRYLSTISWPLISVMLVLALLAVELVTKSGLTGLLARISFDPQTAYYRLLTWEYGGRSVAAHPWIGIGYNPFERPSWMSTSVDAHFLALALRSGLPVPGLIIATIVIAMIGTGLKSARLPSQDRDLLVGLNFALAVLMFIGLSVNYFGEANIWFMMIIGICATFSSGLRLDRQGRFAVLTEPTAPSPHFATR